MLIRDGMAITSLNRGIKLNVYSRYIKLSLPSSDFRYHNFFYTSKIQALLE
jgi:hypothetical protein